MVSTRSWRERAQARQVVESWPPEKSTRAWRCIANKIRGYDRRRPARAPPHFDGLAFLSGRCHRPLADPAPAPEGQARRAGAFQYGLHPRRRGIADRLLHAPRARPLRRRSALAVAVDHASAPGGSLLHRRVFAPLCAAAQIESAARMARDSSPMQKLRGSEWRNVGALLPYVLEYKWRVVFALACLIAAKLANVGVPLVMKEVVDRLDTRTALLAVPVALLAIYGVLRFSATMFGELRDVIFVPVSQRAIRRVALGVFRHLHSLSLRFHLDRQTGGMTRDIERGTRGISTLLSYLIFSIIPVILEIALVAAVLLAKFDWRFAAVTFGAVVVYID